jgi:hypothetical protein
MSDGSPTPKKRIDWQDVFQKTITALAVAAALGLATLLWNNLSQGGLIRLAGGITQAELDKAVSQVKAPQDIFPTGAIVSFDTKCPPGWVLANETIGSAIVGTGATILGETGSALPNGGKFEPNPAGYDATRGTPPKPMGFITSNESFQPISKFVFGVKTGSTPSYLPLFFCKKL